MSRSDTSATTYIRSVLRQLEDAGPGFTSSPGQVWISTTRPSNGERISVCSNSVRATPALISAEATSASASATSTLRTSARLFSRSRA